MKLLVTGAAGFIGAHVVREALAAGHAPVAVVRPGSRTARLDEVADRCVIEDLDVGDRRGLAQVLRDHRPDAIVHLAWYAEPGRYRDAVEENLASLEATAGLLLAASEAGCGRVVLGGTCVEGAASDRGRPIYDAAKRAAHQLGEGFASSGVAVACGHVFYLYGPLEDERRVLPTVVRSVLADRPIGTTTGTQTRDYLHVADVAAGFVTLAASDVLGGVDICSGTLVTLADVLRLIGDQTGRQELIRLGELGPPEDLGYTAAGDPAPLRALGWRPRHDLRTGLADTIAWWTARQEAYP